MHEQLAIDFVPRPAPMPPVDGKRDTSRIAARSLSPGVVARDEGAIEHALRRHGKLTRPELERWTGISTQSITARLRGLVQAQRIEMLADSRPGPSGRPCHLYRLAPGLA